MKKSYITKPPESGPWETGGRFFMHVHYLAVGASELSCAKSKEEVKRLWGSIRNLPGMDEETKKVLYEAAQSRMRALGHEPEVSSPIGLGGLREIVTDFEEKLDEVVKEYGSSAQARELRVRIESIKAALIHWGEVYGTGYTSF